MPVKVGYSGSVINYGVLQNNIYRRMFKSVLMQDLFTELEFLTGLNFSYSPSSIPSSISFSLVGMPFSISHPFSS